MEEISPWGYWGLEAGREGDFDHYSAICEVIDNSIDAKCSNLNISFSWIKKPYKRHEIVTKFVFADDGQGMDPGFLHTCMRLGDSTNRTAEGKIGRFGVGGTNAAISQAKRIEMYSKTKDGQWNYTFLDLEFMHKGEQGINIEGGKGIPKPILRSPPEWVRLPSKSHGTVVIWDKVDKSRLDKGDLKKLKWIIGRTYRKFIGNEIIKNGKITKNESLVKINIENEQIFSHDPLFATINNNFPNDDRSKFTERMTQIPERNNPTEKHNIRIRISELPQSWWEEEGSGGNTHTRERFIHENEGISIIRENREIFYGHLNYFKVKNRDTKDRRPGFVEIDRWVGMEIEFDRTADVVFGVQNNKSRNQISTNAREVLQNELSPTISDFRRKFRRIRGSKKHISTPNPPLDIPGDPNPEPLSPRVMTDLEKKYGKHVAEELSKHAVATKYDLNLDPDGPFIKFNNEYGRLVLTYNMSHPVMQDLNDTMTDKDMNDDVKYVKVKKCLNVILASYGLGKSKMDGEQKDTIDNTLTTLMSYWSNMTSLIAKNIYEKDSV